MTRVRVDFNSRSGGLVRGSQRRADAPLAEGDHVEVFDPDEDMTFPATVAKVDPDSGVAFFEVEWEPAPSPLPAGAVVVSKSLTYGGAATPVLPRQFTSPWPIRVSRPVAL